MDMALGDSKWRHACAFFDDILIFSATFDQHLRHIGDVFSRLRAARLKLKLHKCQWCVPELKYLGHILSRSGLRPDPQRVSALLRMPSPADTSALRAYLGHLQYYHSFLPGLASVVAPLHALLRKGVTFVWSPACQSAFDAANQLLANASTLAFPIFAPDAHPFELHTDASGHGIGAVLLQRQHGHDVPIAFWSRTLSKHERNYTITERECLAVIGAIRKFRQWLHGRPFVVMTDHAALQYLLSIKEPVGRLARWALYLQQFDVTIRHRPGRLHQNADALSRLPVPDAPPATPLRDAAAAHDVAAPGIPIPAVRHVPALPPPRPRERCRRLKRRSVRHYCVSR